MTLNINRRRLASGDASEHERHTIRHGSRGGNLRREERVRQETAKNQSRREERRRRWKNGECGESEAGLGGKDVKYAGGRQRAHRMEKRRGLQ